MDKNLISENEANLFNSKQNKFIQLFGRKPNSFETFILELLFNKDILSLISLQLNKLPETNNTFPDNNLCKENYIYLGDGLECFISSNIKPVSKQTNSSDILPFYLFDSIEKTGNKPLLLSNTFVYRENQSQNFSSILSFINKYAKSIEIPNVFCKRTYNSNLTVLNYYQSVSYSVFDVTDTQFQQLNVNDSIFFVQLTDDYETKEMSETAINDLILKLIQTKRISAVEKIDSKNLIEALVQLIIKTNYGITINLDTFSIIYEKSENNDWIKNKLLTGILFVTDKKTIRDIEFFLLQQNCKFTETGNINNLLKLIIKSDTQLIAEIPTEIIIDKNILVKTQCKKATKKNNSADFSIHSIPEPADLKQTIDDFIKHSVWLINPQPSVNNENSANDTQFSDTQIVHIKNTNKALAITSIIDVDFSETNNELKSEILIAEASRKMVCCGAKPLAVINHNVFDYKSIDHYFDISTHIIHLSKNAKKFDTPLIKTFTLLSEVSKPIAGIEMLGIIHDKTGRMSISFKNKGDLIYLLGESKNDLASSEYLKTIHQVTQTPENHFEMLYEFELQDVVRRLIKNHLICSANSISKGGLLINLIQSSLYYNFGFDITTDAEIREDAFLFGESQSRAVVTVSAEKDTDFIDFMMDSDFPFTLLGHVTKGELRIDDISYGFIDDIKQQLDY